MKSHPFKKEESYFYASADFRCQDNKVKPQFVPLSLYHIVSTCPYGKHINCHENMKMGQFSNVLSRLCKYHMYF